MNYDLEEETIFLEISLVVIHDGRRDKKTNLLLLNHLHPRFMVNILPMKHLFTDNDW